MDESNCFVRACAGSGPISSLFDRLSREDERSRSRAICDHGATSHYGNRPPSSHAQHLHRDIGCHPGPGSGTCGRPKDRRGETMRVVALINEPETMDGYGAPDFTALRPSRLPLARYHREHHVARRPGASLNGPYRRTLRRDSCECIRVGAGYCNPDAMPPPK